jgi:hypothetical protein
MVGSSSSTVPLPEMQEPVLDLCLDMVGGLIIEETWRASIAHFVRDYWL